MKYYYDNILLPELYDELNTWKEKCEALEKALCKAEDEYDDFLHFVADHVLDEPANVRYQANKRITERQKI